MTFRRKRTDTKVGSIERTYNVDFNVRSDMRWGTLMKNLGTESVTEAVAIARGIQRRPSTTQPPKWQKTEAAACRRRGMQPIGGPGAPDCADGNKIVEVKDHARPLTGHQVKAVANKPWAKGKDLTVVAPGGFGPSAKREAKRRGVKLKKR